MFVDRNLPANDLAEDCAGKEEGDVPVGEPSPSAHEKYEGDDEVDGQPPLNRILPARRPPCSKGEGKDKGGRQERR